MSAWKQNSCWLLGGMAAGLLATFVTLAPAQPPRPRAGESRTITGRVQRLTTAPKGEVDGLMLDDGTWVHWPPHLEERFAKLAAEGDRVRVIGFWETGPKGDSKFEVQRITNLRTNVSRDNDFGSPFPRGKERKGKFARRPAVIGDSRTITGRVQSFTTAPKGEVDGLMLDDGTWVHWPPDQENRYANIAAKGDRVRATGAWETGPKGDTKFEVQSLTKLGANGAETPRARADDRDERLRSLEDRLEKLLEEVQRMRRGR